MHGNIFLSMSNGTKGLKKNSNLYMYAYNISEKLKLFLKTVLDIYTFCNCKVVPNISGLKNNRHYNYFNSPPKIISQLFCITNFFLLKNILSIMKACGNTHKCKIYKLTIRYLNDYQENNAGLDKGIIYICIISLLLNANL